MKPRNHLNMYIFKTFGEIVKKDNDPLLLDVLNKIARSHGREEIYSAMKSKVIYYGLKPFHTEYSYLDSEYYYIHMFSHGSTQNLNRCLFPLHLIKEAIVRKNANFNLTDVTGDERLLALLPPKNSNYYSLSNFYKEFTDFDLTHKDLKNMNSTMLKLTIFFFSIYCIATKTKRITILTFLPVFKYANEHGIEQSFEDTFRTTLRRTTLMFLLQRKNI